MGLVMKEGIELSKYQKNIFDFCGKEKENLIVEAVAGSGKTFTLIELMNQIPKSKSCVAVSFTRSIAEELQSKVPKHVRARTLHQIGRAMFFSNGYLDVKVDKDKLSKEIDKVLKDIPMEIYEHINTINFLKRVIPLIKNTLCEVTVDNLINLCNGSDIEMPVGEREVNLVNKILDNCKNNLESIDFDDMLWLPYLLQFKSREYDWVFVDETQDLTKLQFEIVKFLCKDDSRIVAVGDSRQSIYGFRGADIDSMYNFKEFFKCKELPLSICYRCSKRVIEFANKIVPEIEFSENAVIGSVSEIDKSNLLSRVKDGDLVICRTNAPLVSIALSLIKEKRKAIILGRDIGNRIISMVDAMKEVDLFLLESKVKEYKDKQLSLIEKVKRGQYDRKYKKKLMTTVDYCDIILLFVSESDSVEHLKSIVSSIFSDTKEGVICSSVHKVKGLEYDNVFIYGYKQLMPHPMAYTKEEIQQEYNCMYVAITRAKTNLFIVNDRTLGFKKYEDDEPEEKEFTFFD